MVQLCVLSVEDVLGKLGVARDQVAASRLE
jgi:hypothetical protein